MRDFLKFILFMWMFEHPMGVVVLIAVFVLMLIAYPIKALLILFVVLAIKHYLY